MGAIRAVIFDLDDTLYPERQYAFSGFAAVAAAFRAQLGDPIETIDAMRHFFDSKLRSRLFDALLAERGIARDQSLIQRMIEAYRTHLPEIGLYPDADAALARLRGKHKLGLLTDGPSVSQWAKIDALKLRGRFDEIIVTSELGPNCAKPQTDAFQLISHRLGIEAPGCAYVGDNSAKDFIAPNALGWVTVQVTRPDGIYFGSVAPIAGAPHFTVDTLDDLDGILSAA